MKRADKLIWAVLSKDVPHRAWISPAGVTHSLGHPLNTHMGWIDDNRDSLPPHVRDRETHDIYDHMLNAGWVQKHGRRSYTVADTPHIKRAAKHAHAAHPEHSTVSVTVLSKNKNCLVTPKDVVESKDEYNDWSNYPMTGGDPLLAFSKSDKSWEEWRGWISPERAVHTLADSQRRTGYKGLYTHMQWIEDNKDKIHKDLYVHGDPIETWNNMKRAGWKSRGHV